MNQNGNVSKRNKSRSTSGTTSMSSNVQRPINRNSMRNNYSNSINLRGDNVSSRNYPKPVNVNSNPVNHCNIAEVCSGVYKNKRLVHSITSLIGCLIRVHLEDGKQYEGILKTFSSDFELALCSATQVVDDSPEKRNSVNIGNLLAALERKEEVMETLVIDPKKLVSFTVLNVDLDFATKKAVMTDGEIAKNDGSKQHRELVPWEGDDVDASETCLESLDEPSVSNGWKTEEMFKLNESKYNIETTYQDDMSEYTIKLEHRNDEEYRQREAQAAKIAREIEQDSSRIARYAKEDDLDEESLYSAVIRDTEEPNNLPASNNYNHTYRNEVNHSRDERRDNIRNNSDNMGFRTQNTRQNRNRITSNNRGERERPIGSNEPNWRESNNRINTNRYHQSSMTYNPNKSSTTSSYCSGKYNTNQANQYSNSASQAKSTSYSAVSARNVSNEPNVGSNDTEIKTFTNRNSHSNKDYLTNNEDGYQRKPAGGTLLQRETYKQQRTPYSRVVEQQQDSKSHSQNKLESETAKTSLPISSGSSLPTTTLSAREPLLKTNTVSKTESVLGGQSKMKSEEKSLQQHKQSQARITSPKNVGPETKKPESIVTQLAEPAKKNNKFPILTTSKEIPQSEPEVKKIDLSPTTISSASLTNATSSTVVASSSAPNSSPLVSTPINTVTNSANSTVAPEVSPSTITTTSSTDEIVISSKLNPNAKLFTPRTVIPQQAPVVTVSYPHYQSVGHISTTPPSIPSTPSLAAAPSTGQFIQYPHPSGQPHMPTHPSHHHQQQPMRYINGNMQFQSYNHIIPQMVQQYIAIPNVPHFANSIPAGVAVQTAPVPSQSSGPPPSHHMIPNTTVSNQVSSQNNGTLQQPQQPNQTQQSRAHYRSGSKGPSSSNSSQQSQQLMRHHEFSQQTQVANVTGQPIMAGATHSAQHLSVVFPTTAAVHQNPIHGQQGQNIAQLASQPGHNQPLPYMPYPGFHPRPLLQSHHHPQPSLNIAALQTSLYPESHLPAYCTEMPPQLIAAQTMVPMPQGNMPPPSVVSNGGPALVPPSNSPTTQGTVPTSSQQPSF